MTKKLLFLIPLLLMAGCVSKEDRKPVMVSKINGIELYRVYDRGHFVYFSKSGTSWDTQQCHPAGKTTICDTQRHTVPNQQEGATP